MNNKLASPAPPIYTVSDYIADRLTELNINHIFDVPGDFVTNFMNVVVERFPNLQFITTPNELIAGYSADAYTRLKGAGAVAITYGVGAFSLMNAVAGAYVERNPLIVLNGCPSTSDRVYENQKGVLIHHSTGNFTANLDAYKTVTVAAVSIDDPTKAPALIDEAIEAAFKFKRPCYIEVWKDVWQMPCAKVSSKLKLEIPTSDPDVLKAAVANLTQRINNAKAPLFWAGIELQRYALQSSFKKLLVKTNLPYITTLLAKSVIAENNQWFRGVYTGSACEMPIRNTVNKSDLIIGLGTIVTDDYLNLVNSKYADMVVAYDGKLRIGYEEYNNVYLADILKALLSAKTLKQVTINPGPVKKAAALKIPAADALSFNSFFDVVRPWLDDSMTVIIDESDSMYVASDIASNRADSFVSEAAWGSIGYAAGAAAGAALATKYRPVVFAGDGGFHMIGQCLETLVQYCPGTIVFVMNNAIFGIEQALINWKAFEDPSTFEPYNIFPAWNYAALANAFGAKPYRVANMEELTAMLPELKKNKDLVSLIDVVIPTTDLPPQIKRLATE